MKLSCNGCRVLRKGCSDNCTIRPCLQWINSPDSQANATLFLAKFYGRAGLLNLIESGPDHLRPAIFKSLLYEACGRIVNPIYGSVGLLWSGNWAQCQAAFDAVLSGSPIPPIPNPSSPSSSSDAPALHLNIPPLKTCDIRHVSKDPTVVNSVAAADLNKVKTRTKFKRSVMTKQKQYQLIGESSHESRPSLFGNGDSKEEESKFESVETVEGSQVNRAIQDRPVFRFDDSHTEQSEVGLELTLGLVPMPRPHVCSGEGSN